MQRTTAPLLITALLLACASASPDAAVPDWRPLPSTAKSAPPPHLAAYAQLPPGSVTRLARGAHKSEGEWTLHLPDGSRAELELTGEQRHPNGDVTYTGTHRRAGALFHATLTVGREASFGTWKLPDGELRFESWHDQGWLLDARHPDLRLEAADEHALVAGASAGAAAPSTGSRAKSHATTLDVLFLHSAGFAARYPGSATQTRINHLVALANQVFADSGLALGLRVVAIDPTDYPEQDGENQAALVAMGKAMFGEPTAAAFGNLRARRAELGADLVTLIWPHDIETRGSCGIAYLFRNDARLGVNVVSDGFSSWSLCGEGTYAHEVGHNLGAGHQVDPTNPDEAGFGTAHVVPGRFHTIMGSFGSGQADRYLELYRFSNPQQLCGGSACGVAGVSDNARRIHDNMSAVAGYEPMRSALPLPALPAASDPDVDGDGVPESADAFPYDARWHEDGDGDGAADPVDAFPQDAGEQADSDGDGLGDHADGDDDNDGTPDASDAFPRDAGEQHDGDGDGVGDRSDAFPADRREWLDSDGDGIGDHAETDADGDGVPDFGDASRADGVDLLVTSAGSDRVLRFDGSTGLYAGVEMAASHRPLAYGPQSALAWNPHQKRVYVLEAGALRRYERSGPTPLGTFVAPYGSDDPLARLPSSFPAGLAIAEDGTVVIADEGVRVLSRHDAITGRQRPGGVFGAGDELFVRALRDAAIAPGGRVFAMERSGRVHEVSIDSGQLLRTGNPPIGSFRSQADASALAVAPDGSALFIADLAQHRVMRVPMDDLDQAEVFVERRAGGLDGPGGLAFGPDGRLYVSSIGTDQVLRYDGASGAFVDVFSKAPAGTLAEPRDLLFVPRVLDRYPTDASRRVRPVPGGWYNPARSGHGLDLQRVGDQLSVIWYTFEADGSPTWYLGVGPLVQGQWSAPLQRFRWNGSSASHETVGEASLVFSSERAAEFGWTLPGSTGSEPMQPLAVGTSSETQFPTAAWYPPSQSGWGLSVTRQGEAAYAIAFVYDEAGEPSWLTGNAPASADPLVMPMIRFEGPTRCPGCPGDAVPAHLPAGELVFEVLDGGRATVDADFAGGGVDWQRSALPFERLTDTPTQPNGDPVPGD